MFVRTASVGAALLMACSSASAQEWTEQAVLSLFEQQSPMKRETRAAAAAAVEEMRGRSLWPNPVALYTRETVGFTEFVQGEQQLPISGRLALARKAMEPARQSAEADGEARIWAIRSSLRAAFYRSLAAQQQEVFLQGSLAEIRSVIELLATREREGEGSRYDRIRVQRETADLEADIAIARALARGERALLLTYLPQATSIPRVAGEMETRNLTVGLDSVAEQALNRRAEFRAQQARLAQLSLEQQAADRQRIPEPSITAGLKRTQTGIGQLGALQNGSGAAIGISIPLPIFNKGQTEVARLSAEQDRIRAQREVLSQQIRATVAGAHEVFVTRKAALAAFDQAIADSGEELLRTARLGFQEGELGILQLLDAYRLKRQTSMRRLELQLALKESEIELSRAAGFEVTQ